MTNSKDTRVVAEEHRMFTIDNTFNSVVDIPEDGQEINYYGRWRAFYYF